jgi:hypothetical protein
MTSKCAICGATKNISMGLKGTHFGVYKGDLYEGEHQFACCEDCWEKVRENIM